MPKRKLRSKTARNVNRSVRRRVNQEIKCSNCADANQGECIFSEGALCCQRCLRLNLDDCNIHDEVLKVPWEVTYMAGKTDENLQHAGRVRDRNERFGRSSNSKNYTQHIKELVDGQHVLCVGIDVGTGNSAACWEVVAKDQALTPGFNVAFTQVQLGADWYQPTQAAFALKDGEPRLVSFDAEIENLGENGLDRQHVLFLLKLMLASPDAQHNEEEKKMLASIRRSNNKAIEYYRAENLLPENVNGILDVFREWLRSLWDLICDHITSVTDLSPKDLHRICENNTRVVVAVPAIWTPSMNNRFRRLLIDAGFPKPNLRSEPKLAAAAIIRKELQKSFQNHTPTAPEVGKLLKEWRERSIVVVDIGRGTLDLSTVQVTNLFPSLKLTSLLAGAGSMSGNELLDCKFGTALVPILQPYMDEITEAVGMRRNEVIQSFVRGFERAKRDFNVDQTGEVKIAFREVKEIDGALPRIQAIRLTATAIYVPVTLIREVFDDYIELVKALLDQQLEDLDESKFARINRRSIFLVGGGSQIPYISKTLIDHYRKKNQDVTVQDDKHISLVAQGALLAAIDLDLGRREFCRGTYGTLLRVPYDENNPEHQAAAAFRIETPLSGDMSGRTAEGSPDKDTPLYEIPCFQPALWHGTPLDSASAVNECIDIEVESYTDIEDEDDDEPEIDWPCVLKHDIYRTDDPVRRAKREPWSIDTAEVKPELVACLRISIPRDEAKFELLQLDDKPNVKFYRVHFRAKPVWDGLLESWTFMVHPTGKEIITEKDEKEALRVDIELDDALDLTGDDDAASRIQDIV